MNPQKYSQHTYLNHSLLWRKSYSYQKPDLNPKQSCHKQLNQLGQSGIGWRTRNNMIRTNFSGLNLNLNNYQSNNSNISKKSNRFKKSYSYARVSNVLKNHDKQSPQTKNLKKTLILNSGVLERSLKLIEGMEKLKDIKLLNNKDLQKTKYPGVIRHQHVHNDYHQRVTNPGFSRNNAGKHFTR